MPDSSPRHGLYPLPGFTTDRPYAIAKLCFQRVQTMRSHDLHWGKLAAALAHGSLDFRILIQGQSEENRHTKEPISESNTQKRRKAPEWRPSFVGLDVLVSASAKITLKLKPDARGEKKDSVVRSRLDRDDSVPSMPGHTVMKDDQCPLASSPDREVYTGWRLCRSWCKLTIKTQVGCETLVSLRSLRGTSVSHRTEVAPVQG
ncbi:hypothetical protein RRG08_001425 [Elysia crispata]|uniref:Uncharacterized protein n=1 Tax=Elysia crispata TaxID=231223 RepID=A0AAE0ZRM6_9GAST|nr:hypothetical protein RRG08_001425 [Elysia crispata]